MKNTNWLEKIGILLLVIGLILLMVESFTDNKILLAICKQNMLFHFLGIGIWAGGYLQRQNEEKEKD